MNELYKRILETKFLPKFIRIGTIIGINWTFQSLLYMDKTERTFKILLDIILTIVFWILFNMRFSSIIALILAFIISHTLNWIFNSNLFGLFKTFGNIITPKEKFESYLERLKMKVKNEPSIIWAGIYGSLVRGEFKETSDLDVRLIRKPGLINGVRVCLFVMRERTWATFNRFPLDIYVGDCLKFLEKMSKEEKPLIVKGVGKELEVNLKN